MKKTITSCCFTGYRPNKFPFELNQSNAEYIRFENKLTDAVFSLPDEGCHTFYCGMAMGFDIIAAETVLLLKKGIKNTEVRLICVIPFKGQEASFPPEWKERFNNILRNADEIIYLCEQYHKSCFQERNKYMIDNSDIVLTWFDGKSGGTANTLKYAQKKNKRIVNLSGVGIHEYYAQQHFIFEEDEIDY